VIQRDTGKIAVALGVGTTIAGGIPVFLIGALFVQLQGDVHAPAWVLGFSVAAYWAAAAVVSMLSGRVISRIGSRRATIVTISVAIVSLLGSATLVTSWPLLVFWAVVGGAGNGLGHPASNHLITLRVNPAKAATALGIKQAAVPFAAFIAGLTVPILALTVGWQWGFGAAAILSVLLLVAFFRYGPRRVAARKRPPHLRLGRPLVRYLLLIASITTLGAGAAGATSAYAVTAGIDRGLDDAFAGVLLSVGSLLGAVTRVVAGRAADRTRGKHALSMTGWMLIAGALGVVLMSVDTEITYVIGLVLALGIGWGWTGLTHFVVSRVAGPATPSATGIVQTGSYIGSGAGPLLFGLGFAFSTSSAIWLVVGAAYAASAVVAFSLTRRQPPPAPVLPDLV
jgi:MFS family permease